VVVELNTSHEANVGPLILETRTKHGETAHDEHKGIPEHENHYCAKTSKYVAAFPELSGKFQ
jgi:hypothetical protein